MSIVKISEIQSRIGTVIPSISGTIISVFPSKSGKGQHGNWKLQNIQIEDETGKSQVTLSSIDQDLNDSHKGKNIEFESVGTKFGLKGVSIEEREWDDKKTGQKKKTIGVKVTKTAKIRLEGAGMVQEDADDIPMGMDEDPADLRRQAASDKKATTPPQVVSFTPKLEQQSPKSPQERIAQFGKLYQMCIIEATLSGRIDPLVVFTESDIKDIASCLFIQSMKEGLADKMQIGEEPF